jgi:signal transduction histidine kinase
MEPSSPLWLWTRRLSSRPADVVIAVLLAVLGLLSTVLDPFLRGGARTAPATLVLSIVLVLVQTIPLAWRRQRPNLVLILVAAAFALKTVLGINTTIAAVGLLIGVYSVAVYGSGRWRLWALVAAGAVFVSGFVLFAVSGNPRFIAVSVPALAHIAAWLIGDYLRTRRAYVSALEERASRLERERRLDRQIAADEERARIARELHDVVAHDVSVIAIQAGAARTVQQSQPAAAAEALGLIETTARKTLVELSQLLGVLRKVDSDVAQRNPQPGLSQLDRLIEELRAAGLKVDCRVDGEARPLPPALDLSAYRILQESTTNVLKHARAQQVDITLTYRQHEIDLRVRDDGLGSAANGSSSGHGLVGMRERVALFGGQLEAGPVKTGGFEVSARLPLDA